MSMRFLWMFVGRSFGGIWLVGRVVGAVVGEEEAEEGMVVAVVVVTGGTGDGGRREGTGMGVVVGVGV